MPPPALVEGMAFGHALGQGGRLFASYRANLAECGQTLVVI